MRAVALCGLVLAACTSCTATPRNIAPRVKNAWVRAADSTQTTAGYLTLINEGDGELAVVAATGLLADEVQMHETIRTGNLVSMRESSRLVVPARGTLGFAPGSNHFMLIGLRHSLTPGSPVRFTLLFEDGSTLPVEAEVRR